MSRSSAKLPPQLDSTNLFSRHRAVQLSLTPGFTGPLLSVGHGLEPLGLSQNGYIYIYISLSLSISLSLLSVFTKAGWPRLADWVLEGLLGKGGHGQVRRGSACMEAADDSRRLLECKKVPRCFGLLKTPRKSWS